MASPARWIGTAAAVGSLVGALALAEPQKPEAVYKAQAVDLRLPAGQSAGTIDIVVDRWSSNTDRNELRKPLLAPDAGPATLLDVLSKKKPVGTLRTPDGVTYTLRYSHRTSEVGTETVVLATDQPLKFWDAQNIAKTTNYPFSIIEMHLRANGEGDGKVSLVSDIALNKNTGYVELKDYEIGPVLISHVRRESK